MNILPKTLLVEAGAQTNTVEEMHLQRECKVILDIRIIKVRDVSIGLRTA